MPTRFQTARTPCETPLRSPEPLRSLQRRGWRKAAADEVDGRAVARPQTEAGLLPSRGLGGCGLPTRCPNGKNAVCNGTVRNGTARNGTTRNGDIASTSRIGRALGSLISKPWRQRTTKSHAWRSREKKLDAALHEEQRGPFCAALRPPIGVSTSPCLLVAKAPNHQPSGSAQRVTSSAKKGVRTEHVNKIEHASPCR